MNSACQIHFPSSRQTSVSSSIRNASDSLAQMKRLTKSAREKVLNLIPKTTLKKSLEFGDWASEGAVPLLNFTCRCFEHNSKVNLTCQANKTKKSTVLPWEKLDPFNLPSL